MFGFPFRKALQIRYVSLFKNFRDLPVYEQFRIQEKRDVTVHEFRSHILKVVLQEIVPAGEKGFKSEISRPRSMGESYCRLRIPLDERGYQLRYLSSNRAGIRLGRLIEDLDMFSVWLSYLHSQGRENWGKHTVNPCMFVTACCDQVNIAMQDISPNTDLFLEGHVSWAGGSSVETTMRVVQDDKELLDTKFIMVNMNPPNLDKKLPVPQLLHNGPVEDELFKKGEENNKRRRSQKELSFLKRPPNQEQIQELHEIYMKQFGKDLSYLNKRIPEGACWMQDTSRRTTINCFPEDQNFYGKMFGGFLMREAFELAAINSKLFARTRTECIAMDDLMFTEPVEIGDVLELWARVTYTQDQFIQIRVFARRISVDPETRTKRYRTSNTFHFSFVTLDGSKVRTVVPKEYSEGLLYLIGKKHLLECRSRTGL
ncbi:unnamed protein product [Bursaphelenchus xylophilus]|uniref:(pine wood nematode) hypothetical protein n=1 Tax=Bursaphelenchus xylophilus TaxID=6326 RepID=A0A1I7SMH4_BURXY|nr:unnamed protein product [Bursaphelenchus xylophilus]CAG9130210.1 unnamed protein product [Bursaphelenchus xylophilus]